MFYNAKVLVNTFLACDVNMLNRFVSITFTISKYSRKSNLLIFSWLVVRWDSREKERESERARERERERARERERERERES